MITKVKWTERNFSFDFAAGMFPNIAERLRGTAPRIEELVKGLPESVLKKKPGEAWSIQEHIGHLIDLEELHTGRIEDFRRGLPALRPADMTNKKTYEARHNETDISVLLRLFREGRNHFLSLLEKEDEAFLSRTAMHPRLKKPMRVVDMAYFVAEHDDQHLSAMRVLLC